MAKDATPPMGDAPARIFLDTNVFIIGASQPGSPEAHILEWTGFGRSGMAPVEVIVSPPLFLQIRRVGRRLVHKDWAGALLARMWLDLRLVVVDVKPELVEQLAAQGIVPREDIEVYLSAVAGAADCFVSANHELVKVLAAQDNAFLCLTPEEFVARFRS